MYSLRFFLLYKINKYFEKIVKKFKIVLIASKGLKIILIYQLNYFGNFFKFIKKFL